MREINPMGNYRKFGFVMTGGLLLLGVVVPYLKGKPHHMSLIVIAVIFFLLAIVAPILLKKPQEYWMWIGEKLGAINSRILLTIIYFTLFALLHFIFKLIGRDKMKKKWKKYESTFEVKTEISSFTDPF
jgi:hypothetical protein